jgi:hypothetical protein
MKKEIAGLRREVQEHRHALNRAEQELSALERACQHRWAKAIRDDKVTPGYQLEGDPPGTMGIDRQLPCYVPEQREERWRRECQDCGKVEYTSNFNEKTLREPKF